MLYCDPLCCAVIRCAVRVGVSRRDQDEFTVRSHTNAFNAHAAGMYDDEIVPVNGSTAENGKCCFGPVCSALHYPSATVVH